MKIMIVTPYFYPKVGGLENYALNIAKGLKQQGHEVFVVTSNHENKTRVEERVQGLRVIRLPRLFKFSNTPFNPAWYWQLKKIIKNEKPDIINAHTPVPGLADIAIRVAGKIPTVLTCHAVTLRKEGSLVFSIVTRIYEIIQLSTLRKTDSVVVVSDYVKECLPKKYQSKTTVIYNAVDPLMVPKSKITRNPRRLIFIASLDQTHAWKGLSDIMRAVGILKKTSPDIELLVVGDGDMLSQYKSQAQHLNIVENIKFCGHVSGTEKYKLIKSSALMIMYPTSANDAFPTVLLEAWVCKTPAITANIGALSRLINDRENGFHVKPHKSAALAKRVAELLDRSELKKVAETGYAGVLKEFNWPVSVSATQTLFEELKPRVSALYIVNFAINNNLAPSIHVLEVCSNLTKSGINMCLIGPGMQLSQDINFSFRKLYAPRLLFPLTYQICMFFYLTYYLLKYSPDVIYVRQEPFMFIPPLLSRLTRTPLVVEVNGMIEDEVLVDDRLPLRQIFKKIKFFYRIEKHSYRVAEKIITVTEGLRDRLIKKYNIPNTKVIVVENGVNTEELKPLPSKGNDDALGSKIGYVGGLSAWQGLDYVIKAMPQIIEKAPSTRLIIYGEGPESRKLQSLVKELKVSQNVKFGGSVDHSKVNAIINSFDIAVAFYTKDREGLNSPFKVYEYLACGKPVIVSDIQAIGDKFGKVAVVAKAEDVNDFAKKATNLLKDRKQRHRLSKAARSYIAEGHTWGHVADNVAQVIEAAR